MDQNLGWVSYKDIISVTVLMDLSLRNAPEDSPAGKTLTPERPALDVTVLLSNHSHHEYENKFHVHQCQAQTSFTSTNVKLRLRFNIYLTFH